MEQIFNVVPSEENKELPLVEKTPKMNSSNLTDDELKTDLKDAYEQSKDNLQDLIDQGKEAMEEILNIAKAGQHPRAFEVYGTLLKNMVDANKELLAVQKQIREIDGRKETSSAPKTNIDKAIFVGSTTELAKMLKNNGNNN